MKINNQLLASGNALKPSMRTQEANFEQLLRPPIKTRQGDEYYLQHQDQWQESALTFEPINHKTYQPLSALTAAPTTTSSDTTMPRLPPKSPDTTTRHLSPTAHGLSAEPSIVRHSGLRIQTAERRNEISTLGQHEQKIVKEQIKVENITAAISNKQTLCPETLRNNHHLFLNQREAELSLNTQHLNKQQINELQILIKQWLRSKGYSLKQLIINGVTP